MEKILLFDTVGVAPMSTESQLIIQTILLPLFSLQFWAEGAKPANAPASDVQTDQPNWGFGSNVVTKLNNTAAEVSHRFITSQSLS